ncbi:DNA polymerase zeta subunit 2 [Drosophila tropicalis]|uniref:DNA polymerase zeta subunit 2 n=1 Tax=Drosophila tropicalis TaxID=46794 RepID=UPI0035ABEAE4
MQVESETLADINLEAIEIIVNHVLYLRGIYPAQIFKKRRMYNTPVFVSIFPLLNSYIAGILKSARELLLKDVLQCFEIIVYRNEENIETIVESYKIDIRQGSLDKTKDPHLMEYEQQLRAALYKMAERLKPLPKLDKTCQFKIQLHTTQSSFVQLSHVAQYQEFPWIQTQNSVGRSDVKYSLLPLANVDQPVGFKMQAYIYR